jgi:uncharacterized protein YggE
MGDRMNKRRTWAIVSIMVGLALAGCFQNMASDEKVPKITKEELGSLLGNPDLVVVDVRVNSEWKKSEHKMKGAVREDPEKAIDSWADKYPKEKTLVFYCS